MRIDSRNYIPEASQFHLIAGAAEKLDIPLLVQAADTSGKVRLYADYRNDAACCTRMEAPLVPGNVFIEAPESEHSRIAALLQLEERDVSDWVYTLLEDLEVYETVEEFSKRFFSALFIDPTAAVLYMQEAEEYCLLPVTAGLERVRPDTCSHEVIGQLHDAAAQQTAVTIPTGDSESRGYPVSVRGAAAGMILAGNEAGCRLHEKDMTRMIRLFSPVLVKLHKTEMLKKDKSKKDLLLRFSRTFHSSNETSDILESFLSAVDSFYPSAGAEIHLAGEWSSISNHRISQLSFYNPTDIVVEAYQQAEYKRDASTLYIPLKGRQGVYGICTLQTKGETYAPYDDSFLQLLADSCGDSLENAHLYQQTKRHAEDMTAINDFTKLLNKKRSTAVMTNVLAASIQESTGVDQVVCMLKDVRYHHASVLPDRWNEASMEPYRRLMQRDLLEKGEHIFLGTMGKEALFQTAAGIPMVQDNTIIGGVLLLSSKKMALSFEAFKVLQSMTQHAALAVTNAVLQEELRYLLETDALTSLYTRDYMENKVRTSIDQHRGGSLLLFDLDNFKSVNDTYGHQTGDKVLADSAAVLLQAADRFGGTACRWGGEEMALYLPEHGKRTALEAAEWIRVRVPETTEPSVTLSCGISLWKEDETIKLERLFAEADQRLYRAKRNGRNQTAAPDEQEVETEGTGSA
ncbi:GGDEF domain-containing protein [Alkalicoccus chagannorensis]